MSIHTCRFCGKNTDIFTVTAPPDYGDNSQSSEFYVCGGCWDLIAEMVRRMLPSLVSRLRIEIESE